VLGDNEAVVVLLKEAVEVEDNDAVLVKEATVEGVEDGVVLGDNEAVVVLLKEAVEVELKEAVLVLV
jgi:hypothetical protein